MACRKHQLQKGTAVLHQHGDDIAAIDAAHGEPAGNFPNAIIKSCKGNFLAAIFQRSAVRRPPRMKSDEARQVDHLPLRRAGFPAPFPSR
jgi:hypothetical protein